MAHEGDEEDGDETDSHDGNDERNEPGGGVGGTGTIGKEANFLGGGGIRDEDGGSRGRRAFMHGRVAGRRVAELLEDGEGRRGIREEAEVFLIEDGRRRAEGPRGLRGLTDHGFDKCGVGPAGKIV
jgi:hypothetical protein